MKLLNWILKAVLALMAIIVLFVASIYFLEDTSQTLAWAPPTEINGIKAGMTRSDVVFKLGEPERCSEDKVICGWGDLSHRVSFKNDLVHLQNAIGNNIIRSTPFKTSQGMRSLLGVEDILAVSKDFKIKRYTYAQWGATFEYNDDVLVEYMLGHMSWRHATPVGSYVIKGVVVCPGLACPFDSKSGVKQGFRDKDYTYFIK